MITRAPFLPKPRMMALALLPLALIACDDGTEPGLALAGFDPEPVIASLNTLLEGTARIDTATFSLLDADAQLGFRDGGFTLGQTYGFSAASDQWQVDPERTDAPPDAVRVLYYRLGFGAAEFAAPLADLGYVDLVDLEESDAEQVGMTVIPTDPQSDTLAELTQSFARTETATGYTEHAEANGYYRGSAGVVDLVITSDIEATGQTGSELIETVFEMGVQRAGGVYLWQVEESENRDTGDFTTDLTVTVDGTAEVTLRVTGNDNAGTQQAAGTVSHQGQHIADMVLETGGYEFFSPDGTRFRASDQNRLQLFLQAMVLAGFLLVDSVPILFPTPITL